jgi:cell division transport system ATP-binding protein
MIHFEKVSKFFENLTALRNITSSVGRGEMAYISGPSLLRRKIGVVFQDFRLLNRTVYDNIALALRIRDISESSIKPMVHEALKMVNLRHKVDNFPVTLSGGEQQRVTIARALVGEPSVLLADEPTGNLDPDTSDGIMRLFKEINARGTTILHATHDRDLFRGTGYRVFRLEGGALFQEAGL